MKKEGIRTQDDIVKTIEQYSNTIYKVAFSYTKDKTVADDILQDVFIKYMTSSVEYHGEEHKKAWLLRVKHAVFFSVMDLPVRYRLIIHLFYYEELSELQKLCF